MGSGAFVSIRPDKNRILLDTNVILKILDNCMRVNVGDMDDNHTVNINDIFHPKVVYMCNSLIQEVLRKRPKFNEQDVIDKIKNAFKCTIEVEKISKDDRYLSIKLLSRDQEKAERLLAYKINTEGNVVNRESALRALKMFHKPDVEFAAFAARKNAMLVSFDKNLISGCNDAGIICMKLYHPNNNWINREQVEYSHEKSFKYYELGIKLFESHLYEYSIHYLDKYINQCDNYESQDYVKAQTYRDNANNKLKSKPSYTLDRSNDENFKIEYDLGVELYEIGSYSCARKHFDMALRFVNNDEKALSYMGSTLGMMGLVDESLYYYGQLPNDCKEPEALLNKGRTLYYMFEYNEAILCLERAFDMETSDYNKGIILSYKSAAEGMLAGYNGDINLMDDSFSDITDNHVRACDAHDSYVTWFNKGFTMYEWGMSLLDRGFENKANEKFTAAISSFEHALQLNCENAIIESWLALAYYRRKQEGDYEQSETHHASALKLDKNARIARIINF